MTVPPQPHLFDEPAGEPRPLTFRQQFALDVLRREPGGLTSEALGARWHEERMRQGERGHDRDQPCDYCAQTGNELGAALRARGLVVKRHNRVWQALDATETGPAVGDSPGAVEQPTLTAPPAPGGASTVPYNELPADF